MRQTFPKLEPFGDDQKLNLERAFVELRYGLRFLPEKPMESTLMQTVHQLIEDAFAAYQSGERKKGAHLLQEIEDIVNPGRFVEYAARKTFSCELAT